MCAILALNKQKKMSKTKILIAHFYNKAISYFQNKLIIIRNVAYEEGVVLSNLHKFQTITKNSSCQAAIFSGFKANSAELKNVVENRVEDKWCKTYKEIEKLNQINSEFCLKYFLSFAIEIENAILKNSIHFNKNKIQTFMSVFQKIKRQYKKNTKFVNSKNYLLYIVILINNELDTTSSKLFFINILEKYYQNIINYNQNNKIILADQLEISKKIIINEEESHEFIKFFNLKQQNLRFFNSLKSEIEYF